MLEAAHERQRDGIGVVERLVADLPLVPPKTVDYRGRVFNEMDLDAILESRPALVLVDELAQGSRHMKPWGSA